MSRLSKAASWSHAIPVETINQLEKLVPGLTIKPVPNEFFPSQYETEGSFAIELGLRRSLGKLQLWDVHVGPELIGLIVTYAQAENPNTFAELYLMQRTRISQSILRQTRAQLH